MPLPLTALNTTDTWRTWFNRTNEIITSLNGEVVGANVTAYGTFVVGGAAIANTSLLVEGIFKVNSSLIFASGNTTLAANVTATSNANVINFASGSLILQPINGTLVNTAISVNAAATFLGLVSITANTSVTGEFSVSGGACGVRQLLFNSANTILSQSLASPQYDDYGPAGLNECSILALTPSIDVTLTGITAPTNVTTGGRVLYIQNGGATYNISLVSANTSSAANNQFKFPNDTPVVIPPGGVVGVLWTSTAKQWRALSTTPTSGAASLGNTSVTGWLNVSSQLIVAGNASVAGIMTQTGNATFNGTVTASANVNIAGIFTVTGNSVLANTGIGLLSNVAFPITSKTANYTATVNDDVVLANGTFTVTLYTAVGNTGRRVTVKNTNTGIITVKGASTEKVDASNTLTLTQQYQSVTVESDGTQWWVV